VAIVGAVLAGTGVVLLRRRRVIPAPVAEQRAEVTSGRVS
jgi:hypothetical protein